jgi:hypothetical protein
VARGRSERIQRTSSSAHAFPPEREDRLVTSGHSGTPLARKLGIREGHRLALVGAPPGWSVPDLPPEVTVAADLGDGPDVAIAFCPDATTLRVGIRSWGDAVFPASALWIAWPRKAAGHVSDLGDNLIREIVLPLGLVDTKVAALDVDWSGLKFLWRKELRAR